MKSWSGVENHERGIIENPKSFSGGKEKNLFDLITGYYRPQQELFVSRNSDCKLLKEKERWAINCWNKETKV